MRPIRSTNLPVGIMAITDVIELAADGDSEAVIALHEALGQLEGVHERAAEVVKLRFFGGLKQDEIAALLEVSERSVRKYLSVAKLRLFRALEEER